MSALRRVGVPVALGDVDRPEVDGLRPDVPAHAAGTVAGWLPRWATAVRWLGFHTAAVTRNGACCDAASMAVRSPTIIAFSAAVH